MNPPKKPVRNRKVLIILLALIVIIILFVAPGIWTRYSPKPLGNDLEYIGMRSSGFFLIAPQHDDYYYSTDLSLDELTTQYFSRATLTKEPYFDKSSSRRSWNVIMQNIETKEKFYFSYYPEADSMQLAKGQNLDLHGKKNIVEVINRSNYNIAKDSL